MKPLRAFPVLCALLICAGLARAQSHAYGVGEASFQNTSTFVATAASTPTLGSVTLAMNPRSSQGEPIICWGTISWRNTSASSESVVVFSTLGAGGGYATIAAGARGCIPFEQDGQVTTGTSPITVGLKIINSGAGSIDPQLAQLICAAFPQ